MSFKALDWAIDQGNDLTSAEKFVLVVLAYRDNHDEPHGCYPSLKRLAKDCNLSRRTAVRAIRSLERKNKISIRRSGKHGSNHYQITGVWGGDTMTLGSDTMSPGVVTPCHQGGDTMTPEPEVNRKEEPAKNRQSTSPPKPESLRLSPKEARRRFTHVTGCPVPGYKAASEKLLDLCEQYGTGLLDRIQQWHDLYGHGEIRRKKKWAFKDFCDEVDGLPDTLSVDVEALEPRNIVAEYDWEKDVKP